MPSLFTGEIVLRSLDADCRIWRLEQDLVYEIGRLGSRHEITVPAGFETDGATIPQPVRFLFRLDRWGRYSRAAILHDYLLRRIAAGGFVRVRQHPAIRRRAEADAVFLEAMLVCGVSRPLAWLMFAAVRCFGRLWRSPAETSFRS